MEASAGLVAGSHNRNELVVIRRDGDPGPKPPPREQNGQVCQICGDDVGLAPGGEPFVACNECAFPVCRDCYEYERREGTQNCPQCRTRYKRLKGERPQLHPPKCSSALAQMDGPVVRLSMLLRYSQLFTQLVLCAPALCL